MSPPRPDPREEPPNETPEARLKRHSDSVKAAKELALGSRQSATEVGSELQQVTGAIMAAFSNLQDGMRKEIDSLHKELAEVKAQNQSQTQKIETVAVATDAQTTSLKTIQKQTTSLDKIKKISSMWTTGAALLGVCLGEIVKAIWPLIFPHVP